MADVLCAWCGSWIREGEIDHSHGICPACYRRLRGIPDLSEAELDALPFGVIVLDGEGTVLVYNRAEEELAGRRSQDVIGRNFFTEVAPCTSVKAFQGQFAAFCEGSEPSRTFQFTFRFPTGPVKVQILFLHKAAGGVVVVRKLG
ncbi:MAG TPA: PAS domain-containing protein [Holophagaceae bacterium]